MRRINRLRIHALAPQPAGRKPRISAALGAVTVQNVYAKLGGELGNLAGRAPIAETDMA